ncbi:MAG: mechanosensitive ion channel family protein [Bacteroidetes bacterium]|nr:mechanosensitive ion channel family protein [Bacteroidota bacterium]
MHISIGGEKLSNLLVCLVIIVAALLLKRPMAWVMAKVIANITNKYTDKKHAKTFRQMLQHPFEMLLQTILFYVALNQLNVLLNNFVMHRIQDKHEALVVRVSDLVDHVFYFFIILYSIQLVSRLIDFIYHIKKQNPNDVDNISRQQLLPIVKDVAKVLLWTIGVFAMLGVVFHVNIPALIAGLGIGGVAIALAAKESVENLFAAFTILTDKPFHVGDDIKLGSLEGKIERIGFRSTRLRTSDGSAYIIPNKKLVNENLENISNRFSRRIKITVPVEYGTTPAALEKAQSEIKQRLLRTEHILEPVKVFIDGFSEDALQLVISYHVREPLPEGVPLNPLKHAVNMQVYSVLAPYINSGRATKNGLNQDSSDEDSGKEKEDTII